MHCEPKRVQELLDREGFHFFEDPKKGSRKRSDFLSILERLELPRRVVEDAGMELLPLGDVGGDDGHWFRLPAL